jgi:urease accessory protein
VIDSRILIVARPKTLPHIEFRGGIVGRVTAADTVHLVSTAATPLGGDSIGVRVVVEEGAVLRLRSVAATIALPGRDSLASRAHTDLEVAGTLDMDLEPTVVAADAQHHTDVTVRLSDSGSVRLRERVQIGRTGERQGFWSGGLRVDAGLPVLRHRVELGAGSVADDVIAAPRAAVSELHYPQRPDHLDPTATVRDLAAGGVLTTWQGTVLPAQRCA